MPWRARASGQRDGVTPAIIPGRIAGGRVCDQTGARRSFNAHLRAGVSVTVMPSAWGVLDFFGAAARAGSSAAMKGGITLDTRIRIRPDVVSRDLDGEAVILNLTTGFYFGLDPVGTAIWQALGRDPALSAALAALIAEYDVSPERGARDLLQLVAALRENELVDVEREATG